MLAEISRSSGQPITFTTVQHVDDPEAWRTVLDFAVEQNAAGAHLYPQIASRPVGILGGLAGYHPFMRRPSYRPLAGLPVAEQARAAARPRGEGAHPRRARRRPRRRRVDGDVRRGDGQRRRLHVRPRRDRRLRARPGAGLRRDRRGAGRARHRGDVRLPRRGRRHQHRQPRGRRLHGGQPRRDPRDDHAPGHDRRPRRRRRAREAHLRRLEPEHAAHALDARPHPRRDDPARVHGRAADPPHRARSTGSPTAAPSRSASAPTST